MTAATTDDRSMRATPTLPAIYWRGDAVNGVTYYKGRLIADVAGVATKVTAAADLKIRGWCDNTSFVADTSVEALSKVDVLAGQIALDLSDAEPPTVADHLKMMFAEDDHTARRTNNGSTLSPIGRLIAIISVGGVSKALCEVGMFGTEQVDMSADYMLTASLASTADGEGAALVAIEDDGTFTSQTTVEEALQELYQHLYSAVGGYIPIPLTAWREVSATGDVGDASANGGVLASDTTPIYEAVATSNEHAIRWAAADVDAIGVSVVLPRDFDDTADVTLDLVVSSGSTDAATIVCASAWSAGAAGTEVSDSTSDTGTKSATPHTLSVTIANADIPTGSRRVTLRLTPPTHATNGISLYATGLAYKRKLLTS